MNGQDKKSYRLGRRPGEQGPRPLSWNQDRVEKLATGTTNRTSATTTTTTTTVPTSSAQTKTNQVQAEATTTKTNKYVSNK